MKRGCILLFYTLGFMLAGMSCTRSSKDLSQWDNLAEKQLVVQQIPADVPIPVASRTMILIEDKYLIVDIAENDKFCSLYRLTNDSLFFVGYFLNRGRGPNELMEEDIFYLPENNTLVAVGYNPMGKLISIPLNEINNVFEPQTWRISSYPHLGSSANGGIPIDSDTYIGKKRTEDDQMFAIYHINDSTYTDVGIVYPDGDKTVSAKKVSHYGSRIYRRPGYDNQFVFSSMEGNYVTTFSLENNKARDQNDIFTRYPEYIRGSLDKTGPRGLLTVAATNYLYFGDQKVNRMTMFDAMNENGYMAGYVKEIYVSDWEGNPVDRYLLDRPFKPKTVDRNEQYLYGFSYVEESLDVMVARIKIP